MVPHAAVATMHFKHADCSGRLPSPPLPAAADFGRLGRVEELLGEIAAAGQPANEFAWSGLANCYRHMPRVRRVEGWEARARGGGQAASAKCCQSLGKQGSLLMPAATVALCHRRNWCPRMQMRGCCSCWKTSGRRRQPAGSSRQRRQQRQGSMMRTRTCTGMSTRGGGPCSSAAAASGRPTPHSWW